MISKDELMSQTRGGRDIMEYVLPELAKYIGTRRMFRSPLREGDSDPSAHFWVAPDSKWVYLKDFGGGMGLDAVNVYMRLNNCDFPSAMKEIAERLGLTGQTRPDGGYGGRWEERQAMEGQAEGRSVKEKPFTQKELDFLCPGLTEAVCRKMSLGSVEYQSFVKGGREKCLLSTPLFPIFARKARMINAEGSVVGEVTKVYQPRSRADRKGKCYKFSYLESGCSPDKVVNGLYELSRAHEANKDAGKKTIAVRCCGERDALCVAKEGYWPIWFNSESHRMTQWEYGLIMKFCDELYFVPDIDEPGMAAAHHEMRRFPDVKVALLPVGMMSERGDQRKPCKDLRDWCGMNPKENTVRRLLEGACSYKFVRKVKDGYRVSPGDLRFFLRMNGFCKMQHPVTRNEIYMRLKGKVVREVTLGEIRDFIIGNVPFLTHDEKDAVLNARQTEMSRLRDLVVEQLDFTSATEYSQVLHCLNKAFIITHEGIFEVGDRDVNHVWEEKVIRYNVEILNPFFTFSKQPDPMHKGEYWFPLEITDPDSSNVFRYARHICRLHWQTKKEDLSPRQQYEEQKCLQAFMFAMGYMMHRIRLANRVFAPLHLEFNRIPGVNAAGGTGKSFVYDYLLKGMGYKTVLVRCNKKDGLSGQFALQMVDEKTDIIYFDEFRESMDLGELNTVITGEVQTEQKNKPLASLGIRHAPKIAVISNYDPRNLDPSMLRRFSILPASHYYHHDSPLTDFGGSRQISDDFGGMRLWDEDYPEEHALYDINFMMQCMQYYFFVMKNGGKRIEAPTDKIVERIMDTQTEGVFDAYARMHFTGERLDRNLLVSNELAEYNKYLQGILLKPLGRSNKLTKDLKAWCVKMGYIFNPIDVCTDKGDRRITIKNEKYYHIRTSKKKDSPSPASKSDLFTVDGKPDFDKDKPF